MNAYLLSGSPKTDGSTITVLRRLEEELRRVGFETDVEILDRCAIGFCRGCKKCEVDLTCVQRDDMDRIIERMKRADLLVLASPSYWGDVTAQMKVFIDRCTPLCEFINSRSVPEGKIGISISIRAGSREAENIHLLDCFEHFFGHLKIEPAGRFSLTGVNTRADLDRQEEKLEGLRELAVRARDALDR